MKSDALHLMNAIRIAYLRGCQYLADKNRYAEANQLFGKMEQKLHTDKLPHVSAAYDDYYRYIKRHIKSD